MNLPAAFLAVRWLIRDTFRQALASRIFWVVLFVTGVCVVFCLGVGTVNLPTGVAERVPASDGTWQQLSPFEREQSGVDTIDGEVTFLFGASRVPWNMPRETAVHWIQFLLAGALADTVGVLLALLWTAAFLPAFLQPACATVLLAKPVPRWGLLVGKYLGVLAFVAFFALVFVGGTWLALGLRTGVWDKSYFLCVPLLLVHFAIFFSFSALLAVWTRSTTWTMFGSLVFWLFCWGVNFGRHAARAESSAGRALEAGYWLLPKPADLGWILVEALQGGSFLPKAHELEAVRAQGVFVPELSLLTGALFALAAPALAGRRLLRAEY